MNFSVAYRFLFSKYNLSFISIISKVSIIGIMLGVGILITVISVMNGFEKELRDKILGFTSHVNMYVNQSSNIDFVNIIDNDPRIESYSIVHSHEQLVSSDKSKNYPVLIQSIVPSDEAATSNISQMIVSGSFKMKNPTDIVIGISLAEKLGVYIGDKIQLSIISNSYNNNIFTISGIFDSGLYEYNQRLVFANSSNIKNIKDLSFIKLRLTDPMLAKKVSLDLFNIHNIITSNWIENNNALFQAISNEKRVMFVILVLIIGIASFNIISSLTLLVLNKQKEIATLMSLGVSNQSILIIFLIQGLLMGIVGISMGLLLGLLLSININEIVIFIENLFNINLINPDVYNLTKVPYIIYINDLYNICIISFFLVLLSSLYPARKASKLLPSKSLKL